MPFMIPLIDIIKLFLYYIIKNKENKKNLPKKEYKTKVENEKK